jgi:hypothetical protein
MILKRRLMRVLCLLPLLATPLLGQQVTELYVSPDTLRLDPGNRAGLTVQAFDQSGNAVLAVRYRTLDTTVARVAASGVVIAGARGSTRVVVEAGDRSRSVTVLVAAAGGSGSAAASAPEPGSGSTGPIPAVVVLNRRRLFLSPGNQDTLVLIASEEGNRRLSPGLASWRSTDGQVVEVDAAGVVSALGVGRAEVVVGVGNTQLRVPVSVHQPVAWFGVSPALDDTVPVPLGTSREFTVLPHTADSLPIEGVPLQWSVGDTTMVRFDQATGRLTGISPGRTTLTFQAPGFLPKRWAVQVLPGKIAISAGRMTLSPGGRDTLRAEYLDGAGHRTGRAAAGWSTRDSLVARVSSAGVVEAVGPGRALVSARTSFGAETTATIVVTGDLLVASSRGGRFGLYALAIDRPDVFSPVVVDSFANVIDGRYSPDRTRLAFSSDRFGAGNYDLFVSEADGRNPVRITTDPAIDAAPVWAPDGRRLVYVSRQGAIRQLYVVEADGSGIRQLTSLRGGAFDPAIAPDGATVAFAGLPSGPEGRADIYTVPLAGGDPVPVTQTPGVGETHPAYLADGTLVWLETPGGGGPARVVRRGAAGSLLVPPRLVLDLAVSPRGELAWVERVTGEGREAATVTLHWQTPRGNEMTLKGNAGERIMSPAF